MAVGELAVNVTARTASARRNLNSFRADVKRIPGPVGVANKALGRLGGTIAGLAAGAVTVRTFRSIADELDRTAKTAEKLGVTENALMGLRHAGEQTGVAVRTTDMSLQRMVRRVSEAADGSGEAAGALEELGLSAQELERLSADRIFKAIADAMAGVDNQADRLRLTVRLFDSEGAGLVNTLKLGSKGLQRMEADVEKLGNAFSGEQYDSVERFNDEVGRLSKRIGGLGNRFVIEVSPAATHVVTFLERILDAGADLASDPTLAGQAKMRARSRRERLSSLGVLPASRFDETPLDTASRYLGDAYESTEPARDAVGSMTTLILNQIFDTLTTNSQEQSEQLDELIGAVRDNQSGQPNIPQG